MTAWRSSIMKLSSNQPTTHARKASWCSVINTHPTAGWFNVFSASRTTPSNARFLFSRVAGSSFFAALADAARTVLASFAVAVVLVALQCLGGLP